MLDFRSIIHGCKIKRLAFSFKDKAHIRDNGAPCHGIKNKTPRFCEIKQCMRHQLSGYPPRPIIPEAFIAFIKIPLVPGAQPPAELFELFLVSFSIKP